MVGCIPENTSGLCFGDWLMTAAFQKERGYAPAARRRFKGLGFQRLQKPRVDAFSRS